MKLYSPGCMENNKHIKLYYRVYENNKQIELYSLWAWKITINEAVFPWVYGNNSKMKLYYLVCM